MSWVILHKTLWKNNGAVFMSLHCSCHSCRPALWRLASVILRLIFDKKGVRARPQEGLRRSHWGPKGSPKKLTLWPMRPFTR